MGRPIGTVTVGRRNGGPVKSVIALCAAICLATPLIAQQAEIGPPPGRLVDIGGRKLHLHCTGSGSPTVILEAGASAFAIDWALVQPAIARTNRVCSYDRAGHGWSDPGGGGESTVVANLHALLGAAGERPPYVLVGASRGGLYVRLYQMRYPDEVVGLVLVDPTHEERLFTMFEGKPVPIASLTAEQLRSTTPSGSGHVRIPRRSPQAGAPFDRLPRDLYETRIALDKRLIASVPDSVSYEAVRNRAEAERAMLTTLRESRMTQEHPLGERPLVVLTRGIDSNPERVAAYDRLARISANSRHTVVRDAGHEIHLFQPDAVIQAIHDVLEAVRGKTPLPPR
jgi:pimeloyl-ACP methyl ester carboxylesterase